MCHSHTTTGMEPRTSLQLVAKMLGQSRARITLDIYTHVALACQKQHAPHLLKALPKGSDGAPETQLWSLRRVFVTFT